jgi:response regulator RpfG family c-di-GMP phosphodiesterase
LPFVDGYGLCEVIRHDPATRAMPILVVTADARPASLARALQAGADAALVKPFEPAVLSSEAQRLIQRSHELRNRSDQTKIKVAALLRKSESLVQPEQGSKATRMRAHQRYDTTQPPIAPPILRCPSCDSRLSYEISHIGGVSAREPEQWDTFVCPGLCGHFQFRQRTQKLHRV